MALQAAYGQFLAAPSSGALAADASLHYITTTTSFSGATDIIKHLGTLNNQVKKKKEDVLSAIEGADALALELETSLEFVTSGGAYVPGLDDNFLTDRTVSLQIIHMVKFDSERKITQIRQSWDQGALLKQLDVIGRTGRNWPIRDSKEQIALVTRCAKAAGTWVAPVRGRDAAAADEAVVVRSRGNSTNAMRDPHASLSLFAPREELVSELPAAVVSPFAGNRPRQRDFVEILGDEPVDASAEERPQSPTKPKGLSGKNFQPVRLFAREDENGDSTATEVAEGDQAAAAAAAANAAQHMIRPDPKKFQHFDFADGSDPQDAPKPAAAKSLHTRHDSSWSFDDFATPQKPTASRVMHRARERQWSTEGGDDDAAAEQEGEEALAHARKTQQVKPRRDAETHFELQDDGPPANDGRPAGRPRGAGQNTGLGLYQNNLYDEDGSARPNAEAASASILHNITNLKDRHKDFDAHFSVAADSPPPPQQQQHHHHHHHHGGVGADGEDDDGDVPGAGPAKIGKDRKKAVRMMESNWATYDQSPTSQKENSNPNNGFGSSNGGRTGDERGINIAGDGMGGKKGSSRVWGFGDESDGESNVARAVPGKKPGAGPKAKDSFWDF